MDSAFVKIIGMAALVALLFLMLTLLQGLMFWCIWTCGGVGERLFSFMPSEWHRLGFWDCCMLMWLTGIIGSAFNSTVSARAGAKK